MQDLGSMQPEQILRLLIGSLSCAGAIIVFIVAYVVASRRSKARRRTMLGSGFSTPASSFRSSSYTPSSMIRAETSSLAENPRVPQTRPQSAGSVAAEARASSIDVGARLAGTGRDAWLEDAPPASESKPLFGGLPVSHNGQEILRVIRDSATAEFWIKVAGMRYRSVAEIRDRAVGERVLRAITYALRFSDGVVASDQGMVILDLPPCDGVEIPSTFGKVSDAPEPGEIMRLMSDTQRSDFCVHVAERCYHRIVEVDDQTTGQCILETLTRLLQFSNGMLATNDGFGTIAVPSLGRDVFTPLPEPSLPNLEEVAPADVEESLHVEPQASTPVEANPDLISEQERFLRELMTQAKPQPVTEVDVIGRPSVLGGLRRMARRSSDDLLPALNLAEEIDLIFQSKLAVSSLANLDAQIEAAADGGVRIRVGGRFYNSPDEVADARLRDLIKLSIAEWEQS